MTKTITITRPDDWHVHLRDGSMLQFAAAHTAARFARAMVMPNLSPPITTADLALQYRKRILDARPIGSKFTPLLSLYLTDKTTPDEVATASKNSFIVGYKYYPAGATTNSDSGVTRLSALMSVLECIAKHGLVLQLHGEVTDPQVDIFDREAVFIDQILAPLHYQLPHLKIVLEHITTAAAVEFVRTAGPNVAATITAHHLLFNRNELFAGGISPHMYCLPVLKRERHRRALLDAIISGDPKFFLGSDSAPHPRMHKEQSCGCAGIYTAHAALELYAAVFDSVNALDKLEGFASHYGADFYQVARNNSQITLQKKPQKIPNYYLPNGINNASDKNAPPDAIIPLFAGQTIAWSIS